jgi:hypothetical protein
VEEAKEKLFSNSLLPNETKVQLIERVNAYNDVIEIPDQIESIIKQEEEIKARQEKIQNELK